MMDSGLLNGRGLTFGDLPERIIKITERVRSAGGESVLVSNGARAEVGVERAVERHRRHDLHWPIRIPASRAILLAASATQSPSASRPRLADAHRP